MRTVSFLGFDVFDSWEAEAFDLSGLWWSENIFHMKVNLTEYA